MHVCNCKVCRKVVPNFLNDNKLGGKNLQKYLFTPSHFEDTLMFGSFLGEVGLKWGRDSSCKKKKKKKDKEKTNERRKKERLK